MMSHILVLLLAAFMTQCYGEITYSEVEKVHIFPMAPVRFQGGNVPLYIKTYDGFLKDYTDFLCKVEYGDSASIITSHNVDDSNMAAVYKYTLDNLQEGGIVKATVETTDHVHELIGVNPIRIVKVPKKEIVMMEGTVGEAYCLDPDTKEANLTTKWYRNDKAINTLPITEPLKISADEGGIYTCVIGTLEAVNYYKSIDNAAHANATVSVRKHVSMISYKEEVLTAGNYKVTAHIDSPSVLTLKIMDHNGKLLDSGFPSVTTVTNESYVTFIVEDSEDVIYKRNVTLKEIPEENEENYAWVVGVIVLVLVVVGLVFTFYSYKKKKFCCSSGSTVAWLLGCNQGEAAGNGDVMKMKEVEKTPKGSVTGASPSNGEILHKVLENKQEFNESSCALLDENHSNSP
ncbi:hypothetical protein ACF0H5_011941 [Mactra antiquata]